MSTKLAIKPGYRTSEFWFTLVSFIFSGLFLLGIIGDPAQKEELINNVSHGVESTILIGGQLLVLYKYIKGRTEIKEIAIKETSSPPVSTKPKRKPKEKKNESSRSTKTRTRKSSTRNQK
jgi:uncharacterized membrane protein YbhN (UPF0104 family)